MTPGQELELFGLRATNPLGFLAALGVLDVLHRSTRAGTLSWSDELVPHAVVGGADDLSELISEIEADRVRRRSAPLLTWPDGDALPDVKPEPAQLREWARSLFETGDVSSQDQFTALLAEGALDRSGMGKPTHLHFTAGRQLFLVMVRELADALSADDVREALLGPWRYESPLPDLSWDARGERIYALRGTNPAKEKRTGVPGANWLAFLGLSFFPVVTVKGQLETTACDRAWKRSAFRWPVWHVPLDRDVTRSLVADPTLVGGSEQRDLDPQRLRARGIIRVLEAPIRRSDQGGYGSFGAPNVLAFVDPLPIVTT